MFHRGSRRVALRQFESAEALRAPVHLGRLHFASRDGREVGCQHVKHEPLAGAAARRGTAGPAPGSG